MASTPKAADPSVLAHASDLYPSFALILNDPAQSLTIRDMRRGEVLAAAGEVANHVYLPLSGMIRRHFVNAIGKDITCEVMGARTAAALWLSVVNRSPSKYALSAVDSSTVLCVPSGAMMQIAAGDAVSTLGEPFVRLMMADLGRASEHYDALLGCTPSERFGHLRRANPSLLDKLPKHVLASYLGITTVHLGRVRSQFGVGPAQLREANRVTRATA